MGGFSEFTRVLSGKIQDNSGCFLILDIPVDAINSEFREITFSLSCEGKTEFSQGIGVSCCADNAAEVRKTDKGIVLTIRLSVIESFIHRDKRLLAAKRQAFAISNNLDIGCGGRREYEPQGNDL